MSAMSNLAFDFPVQHSHLASETCPYCEQAIPNDKAREIAERHQANEKERSAAIEVRLRETFIIEKQQAEGRAQAAIALAQQGAAAEIQKARDEAQLAHDIERADHEKSLAQALANLRAELSQASADQLTKLQADAEQARQDKQIAETKLREESGQFAQQLARAESLRQTAIEAAVQEAKQTTATEAVEQISKLSAAIADMEASKAAAESEAKAKVSDAEVKQKAAEDLLATTQAKITAEAEARIAEVREVMEENKLQAVQNEQRKHFDEIQNLRATAAKLQRELDNKKSDELGEEAERNQLEALKAAFETDKFEPVAKGEAGADIIHQVIHNGQVCGTIVYECKNRKSWQSKFATKLHADMIAAKADHAILSTCAFPEGQKHLHMEAGVILASPGRVLVLAALLRQHIIHTHVLRVSNVDRSQKIESLYAFISSEQCRNYMESLQGGIAALEEIDADELKAHNKVWEKRGKRIKAMEQTLAGYMHSIAGIIGTAEVAEQGNV